MRRSTSRIGKLPPDVLEAVNEKLHTSWEYREIRKWLFEEVAVEDVPALGLVKGEKFGEVWLRSAKSAANAGHFCELALGNWYRGWHQEWVKKKVLGSEVMRVVKRAAVLTKAAAEESGDGGPRSQNRGESRSENRDSVSSEAASDNVSIDGGDILMRSVLIDAISTMTAGPASLRDAASGSRPDRREVAALANAWAKLKETDMAAKKLRLKTEEALTTGLRAVKEQIQVLPEALELFYKMTDVIDREMAKKKADPLATADER